MNSGVYGSSHPNRHHQLVFAYFYFIFFYPPPYERTVWDYIQPKTNDIKRDIGRFNWEAFLNNWCKCSSFYFSMKRSEILWKTLFLGTTYFAVIETPLGWVVASKLLFSQKFRCASYLPKIIIINRFYLTHALYMFLCPNMTFTQDSHTHVTLK